MWMHVMWKSKTDPRNKISYGSDNPGQMVQSIDDKNGDKYSAKHTR